MTFKCDLHERMQKADWHRRRYWSHPETRLRRVNTTRVRRGLAPYSCPSEIPERGHSASRQDRSGGRFA